MHTNEKRTPASDTTMPIALNQFRQQKEAQMVAGVYAKDPIAVTELYKYCERYFLNHFRGIFFAPDKVAEDILQQTFLTLWTQIEEHRIYADNMQLYGRNGKPFTADLLTYFMAMAKNKHKEWARGNTDTEFCDELLSPDTRLKAQPEPFTGESEDDYWTQRQREILAEVIAEMPKRCYDILTKYYYEEKDLDTILLEIDTITTKNALKTKKYKCMENLREVAWKIYSQELNA